MNSQTKNHMTDAVKYSVGPISKHKDSYKSGIDFITTSIQIGPTSSSECNHQWKQVELFTSTIEECALCKKVKK